ncbi:MAG: sigma-54-dependent Fis family transcriptional regulator [Calditrichaeota bacterium]|nr:MAG: sigma-54-dependent Fis family transcriptional regulator [Calditrichota bacterium]
MKQFPVNILLVGFSEARVKQLQDVLAKQPDYNVFTDEPSHEAGKFNIILAEIGADERTAYSVIERFKIPGHESKLILFSNDTSLGFVVPLVRAGAWNVLPSHIAGFELLNELAQLHHGQKNLSRASTVEQPGILVGASSGMHQLMRDIKKAAPTNARVRITGENGVGKELVALSLHEGSTRADKPFIKVNCAAIPRELIESELFGYEKGAFTGAIKQKKGLIELADSGTLFLDEIGDMAMDTQVKVLRVLQENQFLRVGGDALIPFDVRIISATNKDLRVEIEKGTFRKDLFFRLNVVPLHVLPLREHTEDIPDLIEYFQAVHNFEKKNVAPAAFDIMRNYTWPGNVRELYNLVERVSVMVEEPELTAERLLQIVPNMASQTVRSPHPESAANKRKRSLRERLDAYETEVLQMSWDECEGNISEMARRLSTDRANLHRKLRKYAIH